MSNLFSSYSLAILTDFKFRLGEFDDILDNLDRIWYRLEELGFMATHSYNLMIRAKLKAIEGDYPQSKQFLTQTMSYQSNLATHFMIHQAQMMCAIGEADYKRVRSEAVNALNINHVFVDDRTKVDFVLLMAFLYHADDKYTKAIQLLGLAFSHQKSVVGWATQWTLVTNLESQLKQQVGQAQFDRQWEKGQQLDLSRVMDDLDTYLNNNKYKSANESLVEPLTPRELEILAHIVKGKRNKEIANTLSIAVGTVKTHVYNMCQKLDVDNRVELTLRTQELHLLD